MIIAASYFVLAGYVVPRFAAFKKAKLISLLKFAFLTFFMMCAMTHMEQVVHALNGTPGFKEYASSAHMVVIHVAQAVTALIGALLAWKYVYIIIGPRELIDTLMEDNKTPLSD